MTTTTDITVMGGGIIGLLTARALRTQGMSVTVIDKGFMGQESSWAGGGILLPLYPWRQNGAITELVKHSIGLYPALTNELISDTGVNPELNRCGLLITQNPDISTALAWCNRHQISFAEGNNKLAGLQSKAVHPLFLPEVAQIRNPRLIKALKQDLLDKGVRLIENCQLASVDIEGNRINSITTSKGQFCIGRLIIAAGAWTPTLLADFFPGIRENNLQIQPIKGQMLLYAAKPGLLPHIVLDADNYLIPRLDGHILAGSTVETENFDKTTTPAAKDKLSQFAQNLFPALNDYPLIKQWAGIRPGTANGIPYIGRHQEISNLYINAGHFRNGLAMAPASAQLLADLVLERNPCVDPAPYSLTRLN